MANGRVELWPLVLTTICSSLRLEGDPACWKHQINFEHCCHHTFGPRGNEHCWLGEFTFETCCTLYCPAHRHTCNKEIYMADEASDIVAVLRGTEWKELAGHIDLTGNIAEGRYDVGVNPMSSFVKSFGARSSGLPGFGEVGPSAREFHFIVCNGLFYRSHIALWPAGIESHCQQLLSTHANVAELDRKTAIWHAVLGFYNTFCNHGVAIFRLVLELSHDVLRMDQVVAFPPKTTVVVADMLAAELEDHHDSVASVVQELQQYVGHVFIPRLGTLIGGVLASATATSLLDSWSRTIEAFMFVNSPDTLIPDCLRLARLILEAARSMLTQAFAHFYLTELRGSARDMLPLINGAHSTSRKELRYIFHPFGPLRYNVLKALLINANVQSPSMLEIGVNDAATSSFLLSRIPSLRWVGIDAYAWEGGDAMFAKASARLHPFRDRARLVREPSQLAWNTTEGPVAEVEPGSLDLLFVDGDHSEEIARGDLASWSRLVRSGGIVSGHDIFNPICDGVTDAVLDLLAGSDTTLNFASDHTFWWTKP